jgi:hypothetical protein
LNIDRKPKTALINKLNKRFSIAFDTYNPEIGEMYFDISMFENIFTSVISQIEFDLIEITYGENEKFVYRTFADAIILIKEKEKPENDSCDNILIYQNQKLVCYIETEYYSSIGGPNPYHDTYNFAFFMNQIKQDEIHEVIKQTCQMNEYLIRAIEIGLAEPKQTLRNRLKAFF